MIVRRNSLRNHDTLKEQTKAVVKTMGVLAAPVGAGNNDDDAHLQDSEMPRPKVAVLAAPAAAGDDDDDDDDDAHHQGSKMPRPDDCAGVAVPQYIRQDVEQHRARRQRLSENQRVDRRQQDAEQHMSESQREDSRRQNAEQRRARRQQLSKNQREDSRRQNAEQLRARWHRLSESQREDSQRQDAEQHRARRQQLSESQREDSQRGQDAEQHRVRQLSRREGIVVANRPAVDNTNAILSGEQDVLIPYSIGVRSPCAYCNALLWIHEKGGTSMCCRKGKLR